MGKGLYSANRSYDGKEVTGFLLKYGNLFSYIVEKNDFENMCIDGRNDITVPLKMTRVMEWTIKPID